MAMTEESWQNTDSFSISDLIHIEYDYTYDIRGKKMNNTK